MVNKSFAPGSFAKSRTQQQPIKSEAERDMTNSSEAFDRLATEPEQLLANLGGRPVASSGLNLLILLLLERSSQKKNFKNEHKFF